METKPVADLRKAYKTTVIIGLAMMASLLVYFIVVENIKKHYDPFGGFAPMSNDTAATLRYALLGLAIAEFFLIQLLSKIMLSAKVPLQKTPAAGQFAPEIQRLITAAIVVFALCESVAIYGLVLFLIQGNTTDFYLFLFISLFYFSIYFPKYSTWEAWMKELEKSRRS